MEDKDLKWILSAMAKDNHQIPILDTGITRGDVIDLTYYNTSHCKLRCKPNRLSIKDYIKQMGTRSEHNNICFVYTKDSKKIITRTQLVFLPDRVDHFRTVHLFKPSQNHDNKIYRVKLRYLKGRLKNEVFR